MPVALPEHRRPRVAIHKFSSCDGCQLALLNLGEGLLEMAEHVEFVHFAEMGPVDEDAEVDIALVEGSIATPHEIHRIASIRAKSRFLIALGACATSGGIQALRNTANAPAWVSNIYARPEYIETHQRAETQSQHVHNDNEL